MRIIKNVDGRDVYLTIAGEVLNIERSCLHFIDGVAVSHDNNEPKNMSTAAYPCIEHDGVVDVFRATAGYIFVPVGTDIEAFEGRLMGAIDTQETACGTTYGYQAVCLGHHTVIMAASQDTTVLHSKSTNISHRVVAKRLITRNASLCTHTARFAWVIQHINNFDYEITSQNIEDSISRYVTSILWDGDNVSILPHNSITFTFSPRLLVGHSRVCDEHVYVFMHGEHLLIELSAYWKDNIQHRPLWRNLCAQVHSASIDELGLSMMNHRMKCIVCSSPLWGDNYVLSNTVGVVDCAVCPLCMHASSGSAPLECQFNHIYRVHFPYTIVTTPTMRRNCSDSELTDTIHDARKSTQIVVPQHKAHILMEMRNRTSIHTIAMGYTTITYALIGDQYVAFTDIDHYLYTTLSTGSPLIGTRTVCTMTLVDGRIG